MSIEALRRYNGRGWQFTHNGREFRTGADGFNLYRKRARGGWKQFKTFRGPFSEDEATAKKQLNIQFT